MSLVTFQQEWQVK